jgi:hypothetical protein
MFDLFHRYFEDQSSRTVIPELVEQADDNMVMFANGN